MVTKKAGLSNKFFFTSFIGTILLLSLSCTQNKSTSKAYASQASISISINGSQNVDSLMFSKLGGLSNKDILPFKNPMTVTLNAPLNDLYQLILQKEGKYMAKQLWLDGDDITIRGSIQNNQLQIDTVLNSPLYYYLDKVVPKIRQMINPPSDYQKANDFLIQEITKNIDSPISQELASIFINLNSDKPKNLKTLQELLANQKQNIKMHALSVHRNLDKLLSIATVDFSNFGFYNSNGEKTNISLDKDAVYLLDFWFTSCAPCLVDHKKIQSKYNSFKESEIKLIGISIDSKQSEWIDFLNTHNYDWDNYIEISEKGKFLSQHLGIAVFPTYIVMKGDGEILYRNNSLEKSVTFLRDSDLM